MSDILGVVALIGVVAAVFQLRQVRKLRKREFDDLFVQIRSASSALPTAA